MAAIFKFLGTYKSILLGVSLMVLASCSDEKPEEVVEVKYLFSAVANPQQGGSVSPNQGSYLVGTKLNVKATPNADYRFTGWEGTAIGDANPLSLTVNGNIELVANFSLREYPLSLEIEGEGTVKETVISTRTDYAIGTIVELVAVPDEGWQFKEWQGDLTGSENPTNITINDNKSVKAVFVKQQFSYKVNIIGPGVVDEEIVQTRSLEYGTVLQLTAVPANEKVVFKGWSGSASGTDKVITVTLADKLEITAEFEPQQENQLNYPLPDLMQPSASLKTLYYGIDLSNYVDYNTGYIVTDYNRDGCVDLITTRIDFEGMNEIRLPIHFYLGDKDGNFTIDTINDSKIKGTTSRKLIQGDYNGDGYPDICLIGHGYDADPFPGDYPVILMSQEGPIYKDIRFTDYVSFYHGGASGDFDNDGDLDIVLIDPWGDDSGGKSIMLVNEGKGNFAIHQDLINMFYAYHMYTCELYDIDGDSFLDLIISGHDRGGPFDYSDGENRPFYNTPIVFWGNGKTFNHEDYTRLPAPIARWGVAIDIDFYDLDGDGEDELLFNRTTDGFDGESYQGWYVQVVKRNGRTFSDVTSDYFGSDNYSTDDNWNVWINMQQVGNKTFLLVNPGKPNIKKLYEFVNGKFVKEKYALFPKLINGFPIYSDTSLGFMEKQQYNDYKYTKDAYLGSNCVQIKDGWTLYSSAVFRYENGMDISQLVKDDYCLEFYIKNSDPSLTFDIHLDVLPEQLGGEGLIYGCSFYAENTKHDGTWEVVRVPLKEFNLWWDENPNANFWDRFYQLVFITTSEGGKEFFLDEIRIRKIVDIID